jgi:hypothetical protein
MLAALVLLAAAGDTAADDAEARAIVSKARNARAPAERRETSIEIVSRSGRTSKRALVILSLSDASADRTLVRFSEPLDVARLALLTIQRPGQADEQHLYLPSLKKAKRVASAERTGLFAGTDFAYEDLRVEDLERHEYRLSGSETIQGDDCHRVDAVPKGAERNESGYARRELLISKSLGVVREQRMYGRDSGALVKLLRNDDFRAVGGFPRPHRTEIDHRARGSRTVAVTTAWSVAESLRPEVLTVFELERGR